MPTFADNFQVGDVIYGISLARGPYIQSLPPGTQDACEQNGNYLLCDNYNNRSWLGTAYGQAPDTKQEIDANCDVYQNNGVLNVNQAQSVMEYFDAICANRRSPKKAIGKSLARIQEKGNDSLTDLQIRRACKFGIKYVLMTLQRQVHFVLDHPAFLPGPYMDMDVVVQKTQFNNRVPITTSELRCCYRNRTEWMATGRLKFYMNQFEVVAPWIANPNLWAEYDQHRRDKYPMKAFFGLL